MQIFHLFGACGYIHSKRGEFFVSLKFVFLCLRTCEFSQSKRQSIIQCLTEWEDRKFIFVCSTKNFLINTGHGLFEEKYVFKKKQIKYKFILISVKQTGQ